MEDSIRQRNLNNMSKLNEGVRHGKSIPKTLEQNCVVERLNLNLPINAFGYTTL